jgi:hypothetical protein
MRAYKIILLILLIPAILSTGVPLYHLGDANRDERVDLADAILRVQGIARTAEQPSAFRENLEDALITISAVAGFTRVIKADRGKGSQMYSYLTPVFGPLSSLEFGFLAAAGLPRSDRAFLYHSIDLTPITPPPVYNLT